jgi:valyl-tRNA synthetase
MQKDSSLGYEREMARLWEKEKIYMAEFGKKRIYSIDTPPPTVSGSMHMGHALMYSQMDFIARFRRMMGFRVFYPFGTDDNGLPTEKLVEKINGVKSREMPRKDFIDLCLKTLREILPPFIEDWKKLGISCDYENTYSTIDENSRKISQRYFIDACKKGLVYRKDFPTIWDVVFQTPVAQAELEDREMETLFSTIKFSLKGSKESILIATTRPELLGACVAVFINPRDKRHSRLAGNKAIVPIFNREVPIIADDSASMEKGTGVLMVCSYGDKYDVDAVQRHRLKPRIVINGNGTMKTDVLLNDLTDEDFKKMLAEKLKGTDRVSVKEFRKITLEYLDSKDLVKERKIIRHFVNVYEKSGAEIEFLPAEQWFFKVLEFKKLLIKKARDINWFPRHMLKRYENWANGLEWDWTISRNRHFGVPIPAWICKKCNKTILAKESELPVDPVNARKKCPKCGEAANPEDKVLDTWATSSLTPQIASGIFGSKIKIPYSLRPQGHDIIRTWAFYTTARSLLHEKKIPWKDIFITGNVTLKGEKMSKSKGNVISPQEILEKYGADALRYWAASSKLGEDFEYQEKDVVTGKKLVNKLANAANFVFMNMKGFDFKKPKNLEAIDSIFLNRLSNLVSEAGRAFESYEYSRAKLSLENFFWRDFADNYLEIVKRRIYQGSGNEKKSAQYALYHSFFALLRMFAPIIPFITEKIYREHFGKNESEKSVHLCRWPGATAYKFDNAKNKEIFWETLIGLISRVRQEKTKARKPMNSEIVLTVDEKDDAVLKGLLSPLKDVTNAREIKTGKFSVEFVD